MAKYGNSGGKNKGKKYKKLRGFEQATPESEAAARKFMDWYGSNFEKLKRELIYKGRGFDDEIATDTALTIYDAIALKGAQIESYKHYYFRAYHTNCLRAAQAKKNNTVSIDEGTTVIASTFNYETYEAVVDQLNTEIIEYVRANYDEVAVALFEIYIGLQPDISYRRLSVLLNIPFTKIETKIGAIRKDVAVRFNPRKDFLLSLI